MKKVEKQPETERKTTEVHSENAAREARVNAYIEGIMEKILQRKKEVEEWRSQLPLFIRSKEDVLKIISANKNRERKSIKDQRNLFEYMKHKSKLASACKSKHNPLESQPVEVTNENPKS
ncbi:MAG: hypothetical protein ACKOYC_01270 [Bacteroidota bacterium]